MADNDLNNYLKAMHSKPDIIKKIELITSKRKQAWQIQQGKCAVCKKPLKIYFLKYIEDPKTKAIKIICSDCAINTPKRSELRTNIRN